MNSVRWPVIDSESKELPLRSLILQLSSLMETLSFKQTNSAL